jgi:sn-glycerol 3-phosphate transport system ATP-binding protein
MATVTLEGLGKTYAGGIDAVSGVDLDVADGELIVIVGPSGCGKSTLLRMVAGLETITTGNLMIDGKTVNRLEPAERDIAMVFQNYALYPHMTVYRNMAYGLTNRREPKAEIDRKVREAAETLALTDLLDRRPSQMSGGQRQRVAMGRAIVRNPKVFLFDEPLSNLDAKLRVQMRLEIRRAWRSGDCSASWVSRRCMSPMTRSRR